MHKFDGADYLPPRDDPRLTSQIERVKALMLDNRWRSIRQIAIATGDPENSVSAQLRHLRKEKHGSYRVERKHIGNGLYHYRVLPPLPKGQAEFNL